MSFEYLEAMFWRLHEAKGLLAMKDEKDRVAKAAAQAHVYAIEFSIRDYLRMHAPEKQP